MDKKEIIKLMKEYDFINNSKESFAKKYNISSKTVSNYIKEFNNSIKRINIEDIIKCKKSGVIVNRNRDNFGKFTISRVSTNFGSGGSTERNAEDSSRFENNSIRDRAVITDNTRFGGFAKDSKPIRSLKEYNKKYDKYFPS